MAIELTFKKLLAVIALIAAADALRALRDEMALRRGAVLMFTLLQVCVCVGGKKHSNLSVWGLGFRCEGLGFRCEGLGFRCEGLGFRCEGLGHDGTAWRSADVYPSPGVCAWEGRNTQIN